MIAIISNHLLVHAQGALARLLEPSSFYLANLCGGNKKKMVCVVLALHCAQEKRKKKSPSDYGKSRHHPYLITWAKRTIHAVVFLIQFHHLMSPAHSIPPYTVVPLPSPTETLPPLLVAKGWGGGAANLIKVIGMTDATRVIRSPDNYLQHRTGYTEQERCRAFLQEPQGGTQKLTTNQTFHPVPQQSNLCGETHALFIFSPRQRWGNIAEPSKNRDSCPGLGGGDKREAGFHNLFCLVNNVPQNQ